MNSGVYYITSMVTGKQYFGSSKDLERRMAHHIYYLRRQKSANKLLQAEFNAYGESNLIFAILLYCDESNLKLYEQMCLDSFEAALNLFKDATSAKGYHYSQDVVEHNRLMHIGQPSAFKGRHHTTEAIEKNRLWHIGRHASEATRQKLSLIGRSRKHTAESKAKIAASHRGKKMSESTKAKLRLARLGTAMSDSAKAKIALSNKLNPRRQKRSEVSLPGGQ